MQFHPWYLGSYLLMHGYSIINRLFMRDAGIQFQDIRYAFDDTWQSTSKTLKDKGISRTGKLPVLEYEGKLLSQVNSIGVY